MAKRHEEAEASDREARAVRRLIRSFLSADSYGLVVVMIVVTYVMAAALLRAMGGDDPRVRPDRHGVVGTAHL